MSEIKTPSKWIWILSISAAILLLVLVFVLGRGSCVSCAGIDDCVKEEVKKQLHEQDSILSKQVQKNADTCTVNINVDLCQLDSCTKTEIKYLVSEASRENLGQYINEENKHLTLLAIIIAVLVSIVGIGIPLFLNADMKRQIEEITMQVDKVETAAKQAKDDAEAAKKDAEEIKKKVDEAEKAKEATVQAKADAEAAKKEAEKANEEAKKSEKAAKASKLFAEALAEKDLNKEIELYSEVLALHPASAEAYNNRGVSYAKKGDYNQAIKDFDEAIRLNPKYDTAYYNRGTVYADKGDYDQAIKDYDEAIRLNPKYASAYYNRGLAYRKKGNYDQTIKDYDEAIRLNPKLVAAYCNRGMAYSFKNKPEPAIEDFKKAVELQPDDNNNFNLEMGYVLQSAITFKERKVIDKARDNAQEGLKKAEETKDDDWVNIFQKFLDELPPED